MDAHKGPAPREWPSRLAWALLHGALVAGIGLLMGAALYHQELQRQVNPEDCSWRQGEHYGYLNRQLQILLLRLIIPVHMGWYLEAFCAAWICRAPT